MLQPATFKFIQALEKNNNREWFDANRDQYLTAKEDFETFISGLKTIMVPLEPKLEEQLAKI